MEYWRLTRLGKENIPSLQKAGQEEEVKILKLLDSSEGATVERLV